MTFRDGDGVHPNGLDVFEVIGTDSASLKGLVSAAHDALNTGEFADEPLEFKTLRSLLAERGIKTIDGTGQIMPGVSAYRILFDTPHGRVSAVCMPGSSGANEGLIECWCRGYDGAPVGHMTARQVIGRYFWGGWD